MYKILALIIGLVISICSFAQSDSEDFDSDINLKLMNSTFQIRGEGSCGTGFIMLRKNIHLGGKSTDADVVLITAAHVLDSIKGNYAEILFREKNNNIYKTIFYPIAIRKGKINFYKKHPTLDVAAMSITLLPDFNYRDILHETWLADDKTLIDYKIRPGATINCLGYPLCITDTLGNFPILRSGKIASFPIIPSSVYKTFLFDFGVYKGNSGGPVYFFEDGIKSHLIGKDKVALGGKNSQFIMGILTQEKWATQKDEVTGETNKTFLKIGVVIQAQYILETIKLLP